MKSTPMLAACICLIALRASADPPSDLDLLFTAFLPTDIVTNHFDCHGSWDLKVGGDDRFEPELSELQKIRLKSDPLAILDCDVQFVAIRKRKPEILTERQRVAYRRQTLAEIAKGGGWAKFKGSLLRGYQKDASESQLRKLNPNEAKLNAITDAEATTAKYVAAVKECTTAECGVDALLAMLDTQADEEGHTCHIESSHSYMRFERQGDGNRWIRTQDGTHNTPCGTITTYGLEFKSKAKGSSDLGTWTYTIKWVHTNPDGYARIESAKDLCTHDGVEQYFSAYEYAQKAKVGCTYIGPY